jgi:ribonuclease P/MRP protein subunit RPP40
VAIRRADSVHIPKFDDSPRTRLPEEVEDWELSVSSIFEWTALAALGSQRFMIRLHREFPLTMHRLRANDSIDPLVAVYESPLGSSIGSVVHMRWHGLLPPVFVQNILDVAAYAFSL